MVKIIGLSLFAIALIGCIKPLKPDTAELTGSSTGTRTAPNCAGCHAYPLNDINHQFHLNSDSDNVSQNTANVYPFQRASKIPVCMDCHFGSIASHAYLYPDTTWEGNVHHGADLTGGEKIVSIVFDKPGFSPLLASMGGKPVADTILQRKLDSASNIGGVLEWMTSRKHMNGRVDVEFAPGIPLNTDSIATMYNPVDYSCSNIGCHGSQGKYRWAIKSKGISFTKPHE